jgi:hypothetical protein
VSKPYIVLPLIFLFVLVLLAVVYVLRPQPVTDVFDSPDGRYRIEFSGEKDRPAIPFGTNLMTAELFEASRSIGRTEIHWADWMDSSFNLTYQTFRWHDSDVFALHGIQNKEPIDSGAGDSLTVSNRSQSKIRFINAYFDINRFLIMGLEPNSSRTVFIHHSVAPTWITASITLDDGTELKPAGVNFYESEKRKSERLFRYCLTVRDNTAEISSVDLVGNYNVSQTVPRRLTCEE